MRTSRWRTAALAVFLAITVTACSAPPLEFGSIHELGRSLSADHSVGNPAIVFKPEDTVYVSVQTPNTGAGTVGVEVDVRRAGVE